VSGCLTSSLGFTRVWQKCNVFRKLSHCVWATVHKSLAESDTFGTFRRADASGEGIRLDYRHYQLQTFGDFAVDAHICKPLFMVTQSSEVVAVDNQT